MPVIAVYLRVSTQRQAQSQSTEQQLERLRAYARAQSWELTPEYIFGMTATAAPACSARVWTDCAMRPPARGLIAS